jgi:serine/threonine-protein kinase
MEKVAQGGMGAIYKARDRRLQGKVVAVKEMSESAVAQAERQQVLESFQREAELLARLEHPNLVRVTDRFQENAHHYMVMEFIEGQTLQKMLKERSEPFPEEQVLNWADQLCDVLSYLHSQKPKIIYRDIKPANVMVLAGSDQVKLIDFGIARFHKLGKKRDTIEFGTDGYAPPEQYGKAQTDERSDVYALGAMLHQLLTLREPMTKPFHFPPARNLNPKISRRVDTAIAKALEGSPDKRHQSMKEVRSALVGDGAVQRPKRKQPAVPATPAAPGRLAPTPSSLDFGKVSVGSNVPGQTLRITLPAGEQATLSAGVLWLRITPNKITKPGEHVTVKPDTRYLKPGRLQLHGGVFKRWVGMHTRLLVPAERKIDTHVDIKLKAGYEQRVPVSITIAPQLLPVEIGWFMTIGIMLLEATAVAFILGICIGVILI